MKKYSYTNVYIVYKFINLQRLKVSFYSEYDLADRSWKNYSNQFYLLKFQLWQSPFLVAQIFVMRSYMFPDTISWSDFTKYLQCKIATAWKRDCVFAQQRDGVLAWQRDSVLAWQRDCVLAQQRDGVLAWKRDSVLAWLCVGVTACCVLVWKRDGVLCNSAF